MLPTLLFIMCGGYVDIHGAFSYIEYVHLLIIFLLLSVCHCEVRLRSFAMISVTYLLF